MEGKGSLTRFSEFHFHKMIFRDAESLNVGGKSFLGEQQVKEKKKKEILIFFSFENVIWSSNLAGEKFGFSLTGRAALKKLKLIMVKAGPLLESFFLIYSSQCNQLMAFMLPFRCCARGEALNAKPR